MTMDNLFTILFLGFAALLHLARAQDDGSCSWGGPVPKMKCGPVGENSTYTFFIQLNDTSDTTASGNTFDAEITFDWTDYSYSFSESLESGKLYNFSSTYAYDEAGYYSVGYDVKLTNLGNCVADEASTGSTGLLRVDEDSCRYGVTTDAPTITPSPSEAPTENPTTSGSATKITTATPTVATILTFLVLIGILRS